ncbi:hypothetical protein AVEN_165045-1 [Araneus ventricosus]|uniref:Uncharacterized protein n=1 Tax=Araneus ventricosus TaxID=182803 RepID=A0A4Y2J980_ARAVE|nr:hypothetical protein AVEN_165045-1 [Araneus ventricosus]
MATTFPAQRNQEEGHGRVSPEWPETAINTKLKLMDGIRGRPPFTESDRAFVKSLGNHIFRPSARLQEFPRDFQFRISQLSPFLGRRFIIGVSLEFLHAQMNQVK